MKQSSASVKNTGNQKLVSIAVNADVVGMMHGERTHDLHESPGVQPADR